MKDDFKGMIKEFLVIPLFSYFGKHRRQGRIFFRGLICALQIFVFVYAIVYAVIGAITSAIILKGELLDIIGKLNIIINNCI